jgi:tripartite ATP-independent transporter DctM subunit
MLHKLLAYGIPIWAVQLLLPLGFGLVALRLITHASGKWNGRLIALVVSAVVLAIGVWSPIPPEHLRIPFLVVLLAAAVCGAPVFATLGGAALVLFWTAGEQIVSVPLKYYQLAVNPALPSIPLFTLAGYFLAEGGASRRLLRLFQALFGQMRGGPAIITALACAFFTSFTGASGVTILALGGLLMPVLLAAKFSERSALGLLTGAGSLGLLFPPCLPPILYAIVASTSGGTTIAIQDMFKGGLLPGTLLLVLTAGWGIWCSPKQDVRQRSRFNAAEAWSATWDAKWELLIPVVALVSLFGGFASPVEAAAMTAMYTFLCEAVIYRDLKLRTDVPRVMAECGLLIGGVKLILGVALGLTYFLIDAQIPDQGVAWVTQTIKSKWLFLLVLNLFLLLVGCLMDIYSAIVVVVPLLVPVGLAFQIDPIHLGIIFLANLELGFLAPPVGMNLLLASYRFNKPMSEVTRASLPMLFVLLIGVLLITYVPALTTWLPNYGK